MIALKHIICLKICHMLERRKSTKFRVKSPFEWLFPYIFNKINFHIFKIMLCKYKSLADDIIQEKFVDGKGLILENFCRSSKCNLFN